MNANDMNMVVDKVAEKVNMAVDKVAPIAEEVVRQYQMRAGFIALVMCGLVVLGIIGAIVCFVWTNKRLDAPTAEKFSGYERREIENWGFGLATACVLLLVIVPAIIAIVHLVQWIAPLPSMLGL